MSEINLIYHVASEEIECQCGRIIWGTHCCDDESAVKKDKPVVVKVSKCDEATCEVCARKRAQDEYDSMWDIDSDGYTVCSRCYTKMANICSCFCETCYEDGEFSCHCGNKRIPRDY